MKDIVILVHGMGTHADNNMIQEFTSGVNETAGSLLPGKSYKIEDEVDIVEFNYSKDIDNFLTRLDENLKEITSENLDQLSGLGLAGEAINALKKFHTDFDETFFRSNWMDVILYGTTYYGPKLRVEFARFFCEKLKIANNNNLKFHVISHSLGSAVVHDTLSQLYRKEFSITDDIPDLPTGSFNFDSLWTFANVSRMINLLNKLTDPLTSSVATGSDGCVNLFFNVRHKFDPFTWFKTYNRKMNQSKTYENDVVRRWNTHDFKEYVSDPLVTKRLINTLTPDYYITNSDENKVILHTSIEKHRADTVNEAYTELKAVWDEFREKDKQYDSFMDIYTAIKNVANAIDKLKQDME